MKLVLASAFGCSLLASAAVSAHPRPPTPPGPPTSRPAPRCAPTGTALVEIDHEHDRGVKLPTSITKVFGDGAWTFEETRADGKLGKQASGCLDKTNLATIRTALEAAPWKVTVAKLHCMAYSPTFTVFLANGSDVFTESLCGAETLDEVSAASLVTIQTILDPLTSFELHDGKR